MLTKILGVIVNVLLDVIISKIQLWWAKRKAEYYRKKAEVERKRKESLKEGHATEEAIRKAGDTEVLHSDKAKKYEDRVEELRRRSEERANRESA